MKSLAEDQRLAAAKFELGCLDEKIQALAKQWRGLAVSLRMLEDIRESYEAERQPETLGEASVYLHKLTDGKYTRIWTPLGQNELRVDGRAHRPEVPAGATEVVREVPAAREGVRSAPEHLSDEVDAALTGHQRDGAATVVR